MREQVRPSLSLRVFTYNPYESVRVTCGKRDGGSLREEQQPYICANGAAARQQAMGESRTHTVVELLLGQSQGVKVQQGTRLQHCPSMFVNPISYCCPQRTVPAIRLLAHSADDMMGPADNLSRTDQAGRISFRDSTTYCRTSGRKQGLRCAGTQSGAWVSVSADVPVVAQARSHDCASKFYSQQRRPEAELSRCKHVILVSAWSLRDPWALSTQRAPLGDPLAY